VFGNAQVIFVNTDNTARCQTSKWKWDNYGGFFYKKPGGVCNSRKWELSAQKFKI